MVCTGGLVIFVCYYIVPTDQQQFQHGMIGSETLVNSTFYPPFIYTPRYTIHFSFTTALEFGLFIERKRLFRSTRGAVCRGLIMYSIRRT